MKTFLFFVAGVALSGCAGTMESRGYGDDKVMADYRPGQSRRAPARTPANAPEQKTDQSSDSKCDEECKNAAEKK